MKSKCKNCNSKLNPRNKKYCSFKCYREYAVGIHANKPWLGKKRSEEDRLKFSLSHIGKTYPNRNKPKFLNSNNGWIKKGNIPWNKGKKDCYTTEQLKRILVFNHPNKQEQMLTDILNNLYPNEWKYVGDGQVIIEGKNPDFINTNGQKKIIELFGMRWHEPIEEIQRPKIFERYGYKTLIIWSKDLMGDKKRLFKKLEVFHRS